MFLENNRNLLDMIGKIQVFLGYGNNDTYQPVIASCTLIMGRGFGLFKAWHRDNMQNRKIPNINSLGEPCLGTNRTARSE